MGRFFFRIGDEQDDIGVDFDANEDAIVAAVRTAGEMLRDLGMRAEDCSMIVFDRTHRPIFEIRIKTSKL